MKNIKKVYWLSPAPAKCDTCDTPIQNVFVDGKTEYGPWGCLCMSCFTLGPGIGKLGTGFGQKYQKQQDGKWLKVEG